MRIVIASNNIFRRELSCYILSEAGYRVDESHTIEALLNLLRSHAPTLILLDAQIEDVEPGEILRAVRLLSDAPIIWMTSGSQTSALLRVDNHPADSISWPFRAEELTRTVSSLLGRARATRDRPDLYQHYAGSA